MINKILAEMPATVCAIAAQSGRPPRRRIILKNSCAITALLTLPAVSVGIMLARPAHAQTAISSDSGSTVSLSNYGSGNPFTITAGTTIAAGSGDGVFGDDTPNWTLTNYGTVSGGSANGIGFNNGGTITNGNDGEGGLGLITGATDGAYISGGTGIVINLGTITGNGNSGIELTAGGTAANSGLISGNEYGVRLSGGASTFGNFGTINSVINSGTILQTGLSEAPYNNAGVYLNGSGVVYNGVAQAEEGFGTITNSGALIEGATIGVLGVGDISGVANAGTIIGTGTGVDLRAGGELINVGSVLGGQIGASIGGAGGLVRNAGSYEGQRGYISGASVGLLVSGTMAMVGNYGTIVGYNRNEGELPTGTGVSLSNGGTVVNFSGGLIAGGNAVDIESGPGYVLNGGFITASSDGVLLGIGGTVGNAAGGYISGGNNGIVAAGQAASVSNYGVINGAGDDGVSLNHGGLIINYLGATIAGYHMGAYTGASFSSVMNSGLITAATGDGVSLYMGGNFSNSTTGTVSGGYAGVYLGGGDGSSVQNDGQIGGSSFGILMNGADLVTNSGSGNVAGGEDGILDKAAGGAITNAGSVIGNGEDGVDLSGAGSVTNQSGGLVAGYYAGVRIGGSGTVINSGTISATGAGDGYYAGVALFRGGYVSNSGSGLITGYSAGVGAERDSLTLVNSGTVIGSGATFSAGVYLGDGGTVTNSAGALISGGSYGIISTGKIIPTVVPDIPVPTSYASAFIANSGSIAGGVGIEIANGGVTNDLGGTITGNRYAGIGLGTGTVDNAGQISGGGVGVYVYAGSVGNAATGTITGNTGGVFLYGGGASLSNAGTILQTSSGASYAAVLLRDGGMVSNKAGGTIAGISSGVIVSGQAGSIDNAGSIGGLADYGVYLTAGGTVTNRASGSITGYDAGLRAGAAAAVANAGFIGSSYGHGILLSAGGSVSNASTGVIMGEESAVRLDAAGTVINDGQISSTNSDGVHLEDGGLVQNSGLVSGGEYGVELSGGTLTNLAGGRISGGYGGVTAYGASVVNSGSITGGFSGVQMYGGTLQNMAGALIRGGNLGLYAGYGAVVTNAGTILDDVSAGALLRDDVTLSNQPGGIIAGVAGILVGGTDATIFNAGTIASTITDGDAVYFDGDGTNHLILSTGSVIDGAIDGGGSDSTVELAGTGVLGSAVENFGAGSALTVDNGADWTATGDWTIATVTNSGTFQPGLAGTPLNLAGNFVQASMGTLRVAVTPTMSSEFNISGTAQLAGNVNFVLAPGVYQQRTYDYLSAVGGVTGDYDSITYSGSLPDNLVHAANTLADGAELVLNGAVTPQDDAIFSAQNQAMAVSAQIANSNLLDKAAQGGSTSASAAACKAEAGAMPAATSPNGTSTASRMTGAIASAFCGAGGWIEATGTAMNVNDPDGAAGYHTDSGGFLAGIDKVVNGAGTRLGLAVGYDETWLSDGDGGKATIDTTRVGIYAAQPLGRFTLAADFLYGYADSTTERATGVGTANGGQHSNIFSGGLQGSIELAMGRYTVTPAAGVRLASVNAGGFDESGVIPTFGASGSAEAYTSVQPFVKVGVSRTFITPSFIAITPSVSLGYDYEAGDRGKASVVTDDGFRFSTPHNDLDASTGTVSAGVSAGRNNWSLYARYTGNVSGNWNAQAGELGLQVKF